MFEADLAEIVGLAGDRASVVAPPFGHPDRGLPDRRSVSVDNLYVDIRSGRDLEHAALRLAGKDRELILAATQGLDVDVARLEVLDQDPTVTTGPIHLLLIPRHRAAQHEQSDPRRRLSTLRVDHLQVKDTERRVCFLHFWGPGPVPTLAVLGQIDDLAIRPVSTLVLTHGISARLASVRLVRWREVRVRNRGTRPQVPAQQQKGDRRQDDQDVLQPSCLPLTGPSNSCLTWRLSCSARERHGPTGAGTLTDAWLVADRDRSCEPLSAWP